MEILKTYNSTRQSEAAMSLAMVFTDHMAVVKLAVEGSDSNLSSSSHLVAPPGC